MSKLCKLGDQSCYPNGECHYTGSCPEQVTESNAYTGIWKYSRDCECWICSECGMSALNDYAGRSTPSAFCPHCGKPMIITTEGVED